MNIEQRIDRMEKNIQSQIIQFREDTGKNFDKIFKCLYGNDNPGKGLTDRQSVTEEAVKDIRRICKSREKFLWALASALITMFLFLLTILGFNIDIPQLF